VAMAYNWLENPRTFRQTESFGAPNPRELRIAARIIVDLRMIGTSRNANRRLTLHLMARL
jgi:hypothetical protein